MPDLTLAASPAVVAHVNVLQGIINRLANNSAQCKTWTLTLVSALLAAAVNLHDHYVALAAIVPLVLLGYMDVHYLAFERAYRRLYRDIIEKVRRGTYELVDTYGAAATPSVWEIVKTLGSWAILPVYPGLTGALLLAWATGWLSALSQISRGP